MAVGCIWVGDGEGVWVGATSVLVGGTSVTMAVTGID